MTEDGFFTESDFSRDLARKLISEHGDISQAAKAIYTKCRSERYLGRPVAWRTVSQWISAHVGPRRVATATDDFTRPANAELDNEVASRLKVANVDLDAGSITKVKLYDGFMRGADGEPVKVPMASVTLRPNVTIVIEPRPSPLRAYKPLGVRDAVSERIFIIGDQQIGFWAVCSDDDPKKFTFVPFHDEHAIDVMLQALAIYKPDRVVIVGDFLDFPQLSKFQQEPEWAQTMQASIQEAHDLLAKVRLTVGNGCQMDFLLGNHETRMTRAIVNNNPALYNLKRPGDEWAIYSVPSLLRFKEHAIVCAAEYPSGEVWLAKRRGNIPGLVVTHANPNKKEMRADVIHGHLVLPSLETRQVFYEDGAVTYTRMCVSGCANYSDTGDKVRLTRTNTPSGRARMSSIPSFGTVDIDRKTGLRSYGLHLMTGRAVHFRDRIITSTLRESAAA